MRNDFWNVPRYPDDSDYTTNSPSYYDDLARKQKLIEMLSKRIWEYDEELAKRFDEWDKNLDDFPENVELLLQEWLSDGTLEHIINDTIFNWKADKTYVDSEIERLEQKDEYIINRLSQFVIDVTSPPLPFEKIIGDGDETLKLFNLINYANETSGVLYVPKNLTINIDIMTFENLSHITFLINGTLKRLDNSQDGSLLRFKNCKYLNFKPLYMNGNGFENGASPISEYKDNEQFNACINLDNCEFINIDSLHGHNSAGDIIYITNKSKNITLGTIKATADDQIGRNVVSLIDCTDVHIDSIISRNFAHYRMPGGLDIEPNNELETVQNVYVNSIDLDGSGMSPIALLATNNAISKNIYINTIRLNRDVKYTPLSTPETIFITASDVTINNIIAKDNNSKITPHFLRIDSHGSIPENISINNIDATGFNIGISISKYFKNAKNIYIKGKLKNLKDDGVRLIHGENIYLNLIIDGIGLNRYMINKSEKYLTKNITITGDLSNKDESGHSCFITSVSDEYIQNWSLINLDMDNWSDSRLLNGAGFKGIKNKKNVFGLTERETKNNFATYITGDVITNIKPILLTNDDGDYVIDKWIYLNDEVRFVESKIYV